MAAGVNGAGKSTIIGQYIQAGGGAYYNPDEQTRKLIEAGLDPGQANARSWQMGHEALQRAIDDDRSFVFETTLGGKSIAAELFRALARGRSLTLYYVGLDSVERHLQRVADRVRRGGHDIPEAKIRERFVQSRANLMGFIGTQANIRIWDNSEDDAQGNPQPADVLIITRNRLLYPNSKQSLANTPAWAKPLVMRAIEVCAVPAKLRRYLAPSPG